MKALHHICILLLSCLSVQQAQAQLRTVNFSVDMGEYAAPFDSVFVNGTWNGWCGTCEPLSDVDGDSIWTGTYMIPDGSHEFLFNLDGVENESFQPGALCGVIAGIETHRELIISSDTSLAPSCFNSCFACGAGPDSGLVTFSVDMGNYAGSFTEVAVIGSWNEWGAASSDTLSDPDNDSVWTGTFLVPGGAQIYLFSLDSSSVVESLPLQSPCGITRFAAVERTLYVDGDTTLFSYCWNRCEACDTQSDSVNVTFLVDMSYTYPSPQGVHLAGTFQGWNPGSTPLINLGDGIWGITLSIPPGEIQYKFINGNMWGTEEFVGPACGVNNGLGGYNRIFQVGANDTTIQMHCFDLCDPCQFDYYFQVDLSHLLDSLQVSSVSVAGSWNNWCNNCDPMFDFIGAGVYEAFLTLDRGEQEFLFVINDTLFEEFTGTESCVQEMDPGGPYVRTAKLPEESFMEPVCWETCDPCNYSVFFLVDLSAYQGNFNTVSLVGTMNDWCTNCDELQLIDPSGLYGAEIRVPEGDHSYHFALDDGTVIETFTGTESCVQNSAWGSQRFLSVSSDLFLDPVCWNACEVCTYDITFSVNMLDYADSVQFDSVYLYGSMNNFCGNCDAMTDPDGDGIYSITLPLVKGVYVYQFTVDNLTDSEQLAESDTCAFFDYYTYDYMRFHFAEQDLSLDTICWGTCVDCEPRSMSIFSPTATYELKAYPNPTSSQLFVEADFGNMERSLIRLYAANGQIVFQQSVQAALLELEIPMEDLPVGMYTLNIQNSQGMLSKKIVKQE